MTRPISVVLFTLAALLLSSCGSKKTVESKLVDLAVAQSVTGSRIATYPGKTEAGTTTDLSFMLVGTIDKVLVNEGDHVQKGQLIARLDSRDYQTQLNATQSEYNQIKAECERVIAMHAEKAVSDNNYDKARYGLEQITAKLTHHQDQLKDCMLFSPYDGYVEKVHRADREAVAPGIPVVSIFSSNAADIVINIPETEYMRRRQINSYYAVFSSMPGQRIPLRLKSFTPKANSNQLYQARLVAASPVGGITPGMSVMVYAEYGASGKQSNEVLVPVGAIWAQGQQSYVYRYDEATSTIVAAPVEVSSFRPDGNAVVNTGLQDGDRVVASGVHHLTDGEHVRPLTDPAEIVIKD
ncbi:MAG: efflux RND transporter periplasmic adaptor subunit [Bacteroidales bacterium]|nr:efflux RND transporter periplasmic adaptor subunit [Bacteroidales bacterium]